MAVLTKLISVYKIRSYVDKLSPLVEYFTFRDKFKTTDIIYVKYKKTPLSYRTTGPNYTYMTKL